MNEIENMLVDTLKKYIESCRSLEDQFELKKQMKEVLAKIFEGLSDKDLLTEINFGNVFENGHGYDTIIINAEYIKQPGPDPASTYLLLHTLQSVKKMLPVRYIKTRPNEFRLSFDTYIIVFE